MRTLLLGASFFAATALSAQTTVLSEDFQTGLPGTWTVIIQDTHTVNESVSAFAPGWIALQDPDNPADTIVGATSYFVTPGLADRWLISPPLTLGAYGNALTWQARSHDPSYPDDYHVLVSVTDANPASFTDTLKSVPSESEFWTTRSVNLSLDSFNLNNQTVYIAFVLRSYDEFKLYVDDFQVTKNDPVGLNENTASTLNIYPNPATSELFISEKTETVRIYSLTGELVAEKATKGKNSINISDLTTGTYLVEIKTEKGLARQRLIKQ